MKRALLLLFVIPIIGSPLFSQLPQLQQKAIVLRTMLQRKHYSPRPVDDSLSHHLFNTIIENADPRRLLFTAPEYKQLQAFQYMLDDEINGNGWAFFDKLSVLYKNALLRADTIIQSLTQNSFDFSTDETISQSRHNNTFNFSADRTALFKLWGRFLKFRMLDEMYDQASADSLDKRKFKEAIQVFEPRARDKVKKTEIKFLKKIQEHPSGFDQVLSEIYLNAIASCFDPHSNYFSPQAKEMMQAELSTEGYYFGIVFDENDAGNIVVKQLTPGGAAWKSGEINKGDELISLLWEGKQVQDMTGASIEEVYEVLDQSVHDKMMFRFKKADGTMSNVLLKKEKAENEDNIVRGFILKGEKNIGYIILPGFYTEWENEKGSSCANDVAKEILKLKRENIEGLILDVRYNGGGSIGEAMELTGIFIEEGPLAAIKEREGKVVTLKDPNRGTIYDGPMALLINGQSASASEMLAASLQDYNRAVIIGSNTYGKATMQQLFPMDTITNRLLTGGENRDVIKITVGKLYRVNGGTSQQFGVKPDISLPDAFEGLQIGERYEAFCLPADSVKRNNYYKPLPSLPLKELAISSERRIKDIQEFQVIRQIVNEQRKSLQSATRTVPLKAELFEKWASERILNLELVKGESKKTSSFVAENHSADKLFLKDEYNKERNSTWLEEISRDIHIQETFRVLIDLIDFQKTAAKN